MPVCEICGKIFTQLRNLVQHRPTIHEKSSTSFSCTDCNYTTFRKSSLDRHLKRHTKTSFNPNSPPKVARREPDSSTNHHLLDQNTQQRGFELSPTDVPDEVRQFFHDEQPWGTDQTLRQIYVRNFHRIRDRETYHRRSRIFLRYIIALEKDEQHAYRYKDHLCFLRCLAIVKFGKTRHNCNLKAK